MDENRKRMKDFTTWYSQDIKKYKQWAESMRNRQVFSQERLTDIYNNGKQYILRQREHGELLTIAGLHNACACHKQDIHNMKSGKFDYRLPQFMEYMGISESDISVRRDNDLGFNLEVWTDSNGVEYVMNMYSEIIGKFYLLIQEQLEELAYTNKGNQSGAIFALKSVFGWSDRQPGEVTEQSRTVNIASRDEALRAIKRLSDKTSP